MGLPMVTIVLAENQVLIADALAKHGVSLNLGDNRSVDAGAIAGAVHLLLDDTERRQRMAIRAVTLVDGFGADRVAKELESLTGDQ